MVDYINAIYFEGYYVNLKVNNEDHIETISRPIILIK